MRAYCCWGESKTRIARIYIACIAHSSRHPVRARLVIELVRVCHYVCSQKKNCPEPRPSAPRLERRADIFALFAETGLQPTYYVGLPETCLWSSTSRMSQISQRSSSRGGGPTAPPSRRGRVLRAWRRVCHLAQLVVFAI